MKNCIIMKKPAHRPSSTLTLKFPISELTDSGAVLVCGNLMLPKKAVDGCQGLVPVGALTALAEGNLRPLCENVTFDGSKVRLLCSAAPDSDGNYAICVACDTRPPLSVFRSEAEPFCAVAHEHGWLVMTSAGQLLIRPDDDVSESWTAAWQGVTPPDITFSAVSRGSASSRIEALSLTGTDLSRDHPTLSDAAEHNLTTALLDAYADLSATAAENMAWIQPVIARCNLRDAAGNIIFTSGPQLVACGGWQCCGLITLECSRQDTTLSLPAFTLEASMFAVAVGICSLGSYASLTDSIEIFLSPQIHPVDFNAAADYRIVHPSATAPGLTFALPGTTASMADDSAGRNRRVTALLDRLDVLLHPVRTLAPVETMETVVTNQLRASSSAEIAEVSAALKAAVATYPSAHALRSIAPPHSFTARCVANSGDTILWADITPVVSSPPLPFGSCLGDDTTEWTGTLKVEFADGSSRLTLIGYPRAMPLSLPPLVSYPDASAVKLEIWTDNIDSGIVSHASVPLSSSGDGKHAFYLHPALQETALTVWNEGSYPKAVSAGHTFGARKPGMIVASRVGAPSIPTVAMQLTDAPVVALHQAVRSQSGWDFTRARFYAFSPAGIYAVAYGTSRASLAASHIDPRGVSSGTLTAYTSKGVMAVTRSGQLLRVSASRADVVAHCPGAVALGWHAADERLWVLLSGGIIRSFNLSSFAYHSFIPSRVPAMLYPCREEVLTGDGRALYAPCLTAGETTSVQWSARLPIPRAARAASLYIDLTASLFKGSIKVACDAGNGHHDALSVTVIDIDGAVRGPVVARLSGIMRPFVSIVIEGIVSADFLLSSLRINLLTHRHD